MLLGVVLLVGRARALLRTGEIDQVSFERIPVRSSSGQRTCGGGIPG